MQVFVSYSASKLTENGSQITIMGNICPISVKKLDVAGIKSIQEQCDKIVPEGYTCVILNIVKLEE